MKMHEATELVLGDKYEHTRNYPTMKSNFKTIDEFMGTKNVKDITGQDVHQYGLHLRDMGLAPATINRKMSALRSVLKACVRDYNTLAKMPEFTWHRERSGRIRWLTDDEEKMVLGYFENDGFDWSYDMMDLIIILLDTGMRLSEALSMRPRDVDYDNNLIRLWITKNDLPRSIPMTKRVRSILLHRRNAWREDKFFAINHRQAGHQWKKCREALGFAEDTEFLLHTLRHTFASRLVQKGVDLYRVQRLLGHTDIRTTQRYAHLAPADLESAINVLEG
jgi:integrase